LATALLGPLAALAAWAHGQPAELAFWGGFGPRTAGCQRSLARVTSDCALGAWRLRRTCGEEELHGAGCDRQAVDRAVEQIRIAAGNSVGEPFCRSADLSILNFLDLAEARTDVDRSCRNTASALDSLVFGSLDGAAGPTDADRRCVGAVADAVTFLLGTTLRERTRMLDRIALHVLTPRDKNALLARSEDRIGGISARLEERLASLCGEENLARLYGRPAAELLDEVRRASDCLVGGTYAQAAVICPAP
jgi:hypothetical protein